MGGQAIFCHWWPEEVYTAGQPKRNDKINLKKRKNKQQAYIMEPAKEAEDDKEATDKDSDSTVPPIDKGEEPKAAEGKNEENKN